MKLLHVQYTPAVQTVEGLFWSSERSVL